MKKAIAIISAISAVLSAVTIGLIWLNKRERIEYDDLDLEL